MFGEFFVTLFAAIPFYCFYKSPLYAGIAIMQSLRSSFNYFEPVQERRLDPGEMIAEIIHLLISGACFIADPFYYGIANFTVGLLVFFSYSIFDPEGYAAVVQLRTTTKKARRTSPPAVVAEHPVEKDQPKNPVSAEETKQDKTE